MYFKDKPRRHNAGSQKNVSHGVLEHVQRDPVQSQGGQLKEKNLESEEASVLSFGD